MARRTKEDAERTRAKIFASALELFTKKGYENTTFTDIAARVKMTKGAVYWHFPSKEKLLTELVDAALAKFRRQVEEMMPRTALTFPAVAEMMVNIALATAGEPRGAAFFRLMKCQIRWTSASMQKVRSDLLTDNLFGPKQAFMTALQNDMKAKRARKCDPEEVSSVCLAIWDGLVQAKIDGFLQCDLRSTLEHAYGAVWERIRV